MILSSPVHVPPPIALQLSQQAQDILQNRSSQSGFLNLFSATESPELWLSYENLFYACLRTGNDQSAYACLEKLVGRFGEDNDRVMALTGMYEESIAGDDDMKLRKILEKYDSILVDDPVNIPVTKRRIALLKSLNKPIEAITSLSKFLESSPNDTEAWAELSDLYVGQGMYQQGLFCLEELLIISPYAWNIHARLGEVLYMMAITAASTPNINTALLLKDSLQSFCRSIELCDDYLRGYYGLKLVTDRLLALESESEKSRSGINIHLPTTDHLKRFSKLATCKLSDIVRQITEDESSWQIYAKLEVIAIQELLKTEAAT